MLCFVFHSTVLVILLGATRRAACHRSWISSLLSLTCSMATVWAIRYKADVEKQMTRVPDGEEEDGKLLGRCAEKLKRKGLEFDLLKEVDALRRVKSLPIEAAVRKWSATWFHLRWPLTSNTCCRLLQPPTPRAASHTEPAAAPDSSIIARCRV